MSYFCTSQLAYEGGIQRKTSYISIAIAYTVAVTISTMFLLPRKRITEEHVEGIRLQRRRSTMKTVNDATKETLEKLDIQRKYIQSSLLQRKLQKI